MPKSHLSNNTERIFRTSSQIRLVWLEDAIEGSHGVYATLIGNVGNVWESLNELEENFELRYGGSIGLRVDSIIGPRLYYKLRSPTAS